MTAPSENSALHVRILSCLLACSLGAMSSPGVVHAELQLGSVFTDHMVLQRDLPVPVWGTADPGTRVTVQFAGQEKQAATNSDGNWMLKLDALETSFQPTTMTVRSNSTPAAIELTDVVVGEVWICSGQSNMQMGVKAVPDISDLAAKSTNIRSFSVKRTVAFAPQQRCEGVWVDRYPDSAAAFAFADSLQAKANAPIGIILSCWGSTSIEAWMPRDMTATVPHFKTMMEEFDANTAARDQINAALTGPQPWSRTEDVFLRRQSSIIYNAMMHPLAPFACRGIVWYQGERNTQSMQGMVTSPWYSRNSGMVRYGDVLQQWIKRYRQQWGRPDLHVLIVMLPGYGSVLESSNDVPADHPAAHSWAWMRESQLSAMNLRHTAVANTIDLGDVKNIHPKDKLPIGQRLALIAARETLNQDIQAFGPIFKQAEISDDAITVHFAGADGLKTNDGKAPRAFWLADATQQWVRADAVIDGERVVLRSSELPRPLHVRYGFVGKPNVNLVNDANLPAYPFRTDRFDP